MRASKPLTSLSQSVFRHDYQRRCSLDVDPLVLGRLISLGGAGFEDLEARLAIVEICQLRLQRLPPPIYV